VEAPPDIFVTSFNKKLYSALLDRLSGCDGFTVSMLADEFSPDEMARISGIEALNRDFDINHDVFVDCVNVLRNQPADINSHSNEITDDELLDLFKAKRKNL
jgi:DNA primase